MSAHQGLGCPLSLPATFCVSLVKILKIVHKSKCMGLGVIISWVTCAHRHSGISLSRAGQQGTGSFYVGRKESFSIIGPSWQHTVAFAHLEMMLVVGERQAAVLRLDRKHAGAGSGL